MRRTNELLMDPPIAQEAVRETATAAIKSMLFIVHDDDGLENRLQAALSMARACSAHLQLLHVVPVEAFTVVDTLGSAFASGEIVEALQQAAAELQARLERHLAKEDVSWSYEIATAPVLRALRMNAALADIVFIGRQPRWHEFGRTGPALLGELVCSGRTPLCIPGDGTTSFDPFGNAVIAWNGSIEGANAVRASIGLLRMARDVRIVRYTEREDTSFPDTRLVEYLSRHGIPAVLDVRPARINFTDDLLEYAGVFAAEYLVMGGYSHTRAGEFVFGGVTRDLLRRSRVSLVIAH